MEKNAIIAAVLSIVVLLGWQYFVLRPMAEKEARRKQAAKARRGAKGKKKEAPAATPLRAQPLAPAPVPGGAAPEPAPTLAAGEEARVRVDVGGAVYELTNRGAALVSARMKKYRDAEGRPIDLAPSGRTSLRPLYFSGSAAAARLNAAAYRVEGGDLHLSRSRPEGTIRFLYRGADGLAAEKTFTFRHDSHAIALKVRVEKPSDPAPIGLMWAPAVGGSDGNTYGGVIEGPMSYVGEKLLYDEPEEGKPVTRGADLRWAALQTKYFIAALVPRSGAGGAEIRLLEKEGNEKNYAVIVPLDDGKRAAAAFDVYVGPKETHRLARLEVGLEDSLDYGMFSFIARPLMFALRIFYGLSGNWGIAIILLTVLIKILFYPLTQVSMRNMREMQKLQPKMAQIREIYKDDRTKMNEQVMALYREHKVNPMMGCLPMIIQIPVFFGLYEALLVSIELRNAPFFWWVQDLSRQDPYHVYTVLMGASMFLQMKMSPSTGDPTQAKMMMFMPVVFTAMFIFYPVPVGLVIYWLVNNVLSIVQQYFVNRSVQPPKLAEES